MVSVVIEAGKDDEGLARTLASLVPAADHLLFAPRAGSQDAFQTLTVPMAICNGLVLSMAKEDPKASLQHLETLGQLIDTFD